MRGAAYLRYGERWTCEKCGKTWNTNRIPVEQYAAIRATQMRYRRIPIAISVFALAAVIACILVGKAVGGLLVIGILATTWSMFFRPDPSPQVPGGDRRAAHLEDQA